MEQILVIDFGGQYAHLITSRIRSHNVLATIAEPEALTPEFIRDKNIRGIILSGGPQSVYDHNAPKINTEVFAFGIPILGICYGHQFISHHTGGVVESGQNKKEYGSATLTHTGDCPLFEGIPEQSIFWMSHSDKVTQLGGEARVCAKTDTCEYAAFWDASKNIFGIQFHPEVTHSEHGSQILKNFINICEIKDQWTMEHFLEAEKTKLQEKIAKKKVVVFVSGGVDSTVCFALLSKIISNENLTGLFVDTGLLRQGERDFVKNSLEKIGINLVVLDESKRFFKALSGVHDPEKKRNIIGNLFVQIQEEFFRENFLNSYCLLAQGTIYPDTIETGETKHASKIKTHHNRSEAMQKAIDEERVIEPIKYLYKDEVRALGMELGLPKDLVWRHPFPGPGLGIRLLCSSKSDTQKLQPTNDITGEFSYIPLPIKSVGVQGDFRTYRHPAVLQIPDLDLENIKKYTHIATQIVNQSESVNRIILCLGRQNFRENFDTVFLHQSDVSPQRVQTLQQADHHNTTNMQSANILEKVWQFPVVLLPLSFEDTTKESVILRPIASVDAMSADIPSLDMNFYKSVTRDILTDKSISAVFLDITSKPPGTIEWE